MAAAAIVGEGCWQGRLRDELRGLLAPVFCRARSRLAAFGYVDALLAEPGDRRSCWQLAEAAGHVTPRRMQALLAEHAWDWKAALTGLQRFILCHLGDPGAVLVLDETAELKKGQMTVGVARQHAGITGQVENCQTVVFCSYVTARGHAPYDFRLYLPKAWCADKQRRERAKVPEDIGFKTKTELGAVMVTEAISAGVPFGFLAGDEVYGRSSKLRAACEQGGKAYVLAVPCDFRARLHPRRGKVRADTAARLVPAAAWETRSCGRGCKGHRDYHWAWLATASPRHWLLVRRKISDPAELPGSPSALLHRGPLRTAHARSHARGPSKPLGRFRCLAGRHGACPPFRRVVAVAGRWRVRGVSGDGVRRCLAGCGGLGSPP